MRQKSTSKTATNKRWVDYCPPEKARPNKPELARAAAEALGPFVYGTQAAASRAPDWSDRWGPPSLSAEYAEQAIKQIAEYYNENEYLAADAPRASHVLERLSKLADQAHALAMYLEELDDQTRDELLKGGGLTTSELKFWREMQQANAFGLPRPARDTQTPPQWLWTEKLFALARYCQITRANVLEFRRAIGRPVDRGGATNLFTEQGPPRWQLVSDCLQLFEMFKPDSATGTPGQAFHAFALQVYEVATGLEPEIHAKLDDYIKQMVPAHRKSRMLGERLVVIRNELDALEKFEKLSAEQESRWDDLVTLENRLSEEKDECNRQYAPHLKFDWRDVKGLVMPPVSSG